MTETRQESCISDCAVKITWKKGIAAGNRKSIAGRVKIDPSKTEAITKMPLPRSVIEL